jgi:hypothetical protein
MSRLCALRHDSMHGWVVEQPRYTEGMHAVLRRVVPTPVVTPCHYKSRTTPEKKRGGLEGKEPIDSFLGTTHVTIVHRHHIHHSCRM